MILYVQGDIFQSPAQVLVNTVNTVGVMGKGIALQYKKLFPEMFAEYKELCESGRFTVGMLWLYETSNKRILNFPTKQHWRQPSRLEYIEAGLSKFANTYQEKRIHSIAFPPLGCGNGQLDFATQVQPLMEKYLRRLPIDVFIYPEMKNDFVEHLSQDEMKRWLRSEPKSLPFSEVWEDLVQVLERQGTFTTVSDGTVFDAYLQNEPLSILVSVNQEQLVISYETLKDLWQQLRAHGFSMARIAPGLSYELSYVLPLLSELNYISPVHIADRYTSLAMPDIIGLQILPAAFQRNFNDNAFKQLALFQ